MLVNVGPILIAVLAGLLLGEGFPRRLFAGCAVAFAGVVAIGLGGSHEGSAAGVALLLLAASAYAAAVVIQKPALARVSPLQATWLGCTAGTLACLPFAPTLARELDGPGLAAVVYLGLVPTALGFAAYAVALRHMTAGRLAALTYLIPVVAIALGWAVLAETPAPLAFAGGALCLAGVLVARRGA
jgi:drug/metabolite transporter (DMT)-like permease